MKQHGMRQVSCDTEVGKLTTDYRVLDVRRPIWSLGSMMDSGCDVHFTKNRCWFSKDDGKELDMIRSGGVFFVAARPSKSSSRAANALELNPMTAAEVEQAALDKGTRCVRNPGSRCRSNVGRRWRARSAYQGSHRPCDAISWRKSATRGFRTRALSKLVSLVHCGASGGQATFERTATRHRWSRAKNWIWLRGSRTRGVLPSMQSMVALRACQRHFVPRKDSVNILRKRFWRPLKHLDTMWWCCTQTKSRCWYSCWLCRADESSEHWWDMAREPAIRVKARLKMRIEWSMVSVVRCGYHLRIFCEKNYQATASW